MFFHSLQAQPVFIFSVNILFHDGQNLNKPKCFAKKEEWLPSFPDSLVMKKMRKFGICFFVF
jgi:hypothetical protein